VRTRLSPARNRSGIDQLRHADNSAQASCARSSMPDEALMPTRSGGKFFVSPADARHHRPTDQRLRRPKLVEQASRQLWTAGAVFRQLCIRITVCSSVSPGTGMTCGVSKQWRRLTHHGFASCRVRPEFARTHCRVAADKSLAPSLMQHKSELSQRAGSAARYEQGRRIAGLTEMRSINRRLLDRAEFVRHADREDRHEQYHRHWYARVRWKRSQTADNSTRIVGDGIPHRLEDRCHTPPAPTIEAVVTRGRHSLPSYRRRPLSEEGRLAHDTAPCEGRGRVSRHSHQVMADGGVFARPKEPEEAKGASIPGPRPAASGWARPQLTQK
jgi:hypothetical protein